MEMEKLMQLQQVMNINFRVYQHYELISEQYLSIFDVKTKIHFKQRTLRSMETLETMKESI